MIRYNQRDQLESTSQTNKTQERTRTRRPLEIARHEIRILQRRARALSARRGSHDAQERQRRLTTSNFWRNENNPDKTPHQRSSFVQECRQETIGQTRRTPLGEVSCVVLRCVALRCNDHQSSRRTPSLFRLGCCYP